MCRYEELFSQLKQALDWMLIPALKQARELLEQIQGELEENEEYKDLLGEWNLLMARINFFNPDKAIMYLQGARDMIEGRSRIVPYGTGFSMEVYGPLFMFLRVPGTADAVGKKLEKMMELYESLCGGISRYDQLYYAQLAYYRGEFEKAQELFLKAERSARKSGNLLDQLCTAEYRTRIAFHMRDRNAWQQGFNFICSMLNNENRVVCEMAACMKSQLLMSIGLMTGVPKWIKSGRFGAISEGCYYKMVEDRVSHSVFPVAWITYMEYILYKGDFYRVINGADIASSLYGLDWMLLYDVYLRMYKASAWNALKNQERTVEHLRKAVEILAPDGLWLFCAEFIPTLGDHLLKEIEPFGEDVVNRYRGFSKTHVEKLTNTGKILKSVVWDEPMTEKEHTVASLAALGLKNEEIGDRLCISKNTVKYHLANIYKKLGISNRVELKDAIEAKSEAEYAFWTDFHEDDKCRKIT